MQRSAPQVVLRFGPFEANLQTGELRNSGVPVKLAPQAFQILALLAGAPGQLVTREAIQQTLWPHDTVVDWEDGINTAVRRIRTALHDSRSEPRYIETLSRRGYRFIAPVERLPLHAPAPGPEPAQQPAHTPSETVSPNSAKASTGWIDPTGQTVSHYRVFEMLGRGGMGIVYRAEDLRLGRQVALKFQAPGSEGDQDAAARFAREARLVSSLNHPNICTIFEVDHFGGRPFFAMELLEGETLRSRMAQSAPGPAAPVSALLDIAIAVADALEAAHACGVIHRDIKPANIFLARNGGVKVLDFGLAKSAPRLNRAAPGATGDSLTSAGVAIGTLAYMSPEQRRAEELDGRADLYSFGAVLYEAASGRPFDGRWEPAALPADLASHLPPRGWEIIDRLVDPDRSLRYQTAGDLASDLRRLRRDLSSGQIASPAAPLRAARKVRGRVALLAAAGCLTIAAAFFLVWSNRNQPVGMLSVQPLTGMAARESDPGFSPDGKMVAYSLESEGASRIYVKLIGGGPPLALTSGPSDTAPAWSPDARTIAFVCHPVNTPLQICVAPSLGGPEAVITSVDPLAPDRGSRVISWLSNGEGLLASDRVSRGNPQAIFEVSAGSGSKRQLTEPPRDTLGDGDPEVSPDGRSFAFLRWVGDSVDDIYVKPLAGGHERRVTFDGNRISSLAWTADGRSIVFQSRRGALPSLWIVPAAGGSVQPLLGIGGDAGEVAIAREGHRLAYVHSWQNVDLWKIAGPAASAPLAKSEVLAVSPRQDTSGEYSPDGRRIVFSSDRTGSFEIWTADADGSHLQELTFFKGPITGTPHWSPDGHWITFDSRPAGHGAIFVIGSEGGQPRAVTTDAFDDIVPSWSRDGQSIYFSSDRGSGSQVFRIPAGGGQAVQITRQGGFEAAESPDRAWLYYLKPSGGIWRAPLAGGDEHLVSRKFVARFWSITPFGLAYLDINGRPRSLNVMDPNTGRTTRLGVMEGQVAWGSSGFSVSPDGRWLLFAQLDRLVSEITVAENFH